MKSLVLAMVFVAGGMLSVCVCAGCGPKATTLAGPAISGPLEKPGVYCEAQKGILGGKVKVKLTTEGTFSADKVAFNGDDKNKSLTIDKPLLSPTNIVNETNAGTDQMLKGILPLDQEFRALQKQYGDNTVAIVGAFDGLATAVLNGLPAGQIRQAFDHLMDVYAATHPAPATQPAAKSDTGSVATQ